MYKKKYSARGLSLVELMIAITLSMVLLTVLISVYLGGVRVYKAQSAEQEAHNNLSVVLQILKNEIIKAGFISNPQENKIPISNDTNYDLNLIQNIKINETGITITHYQTPAGQLMADMTNNNEMYLDGTKEVSAKDLLLIMDDINTEVFEVAQVSSLGLGQRIITARPLRNKYQAQSRVSFFEQNSFQINQGHLYFKKHKQYSQDLIGGLD
ncbi:MAG TPA: prepilin-type N-terminal cleavage/methylation domain-containing protein, partial [Gammaproteobacteria bacterium]|nr:prepilin-type N-terminal cleavage/methylation domain-containing protein [Gammaproteobacteria bacterium]